MTSSCLLRRLGAGSGKASSCAKCRSASETAALSDSSSAAWAGRGDGVESELIERDAPLAGELGARAAVLLMSRSRLERSGSGEAMAKARRVGNLRGSVDAIAMDEYADFMRSKQCLLPKGAGTRPLHVERAIQDGLYGLTPADAKERGEPRGDVSR